ncbi:uncharacterized protein LOC115278379 isoform X2 [Suricata suricatta]|uniref:uncharacterized protein LOC115278379 isoform X2 n=1 Tax=Suricata suricatta TaxID=37032 RepID=UPI0011564DAF|nr:uncharacterized protein LOC115278379 isoform X2 [Suricata suricatta]
MRWFHPLVSVTGERVAGDPVGFSEIQCGNQQGRGIFLLSWEAEGTWARCPLPHEGRAPLGTKPAQKKQEMSPDGVVLSAWIQLCLKLVQIPDFTVTRATKYSLLLQSPRIGILSLETKGPDRLMMDGARPRGPKWKILGCLVGPFMLAQAQKAVGEQNLISGTRGPGQRRGEPDRSRDAGFPLCEQSRASGWRPESPVCTLDPPS